MPSFLTKLKAAQSYDPYVIERLTAYLRRRGMVSRVINLSLALFFVSGRRTVGVLRRVRRLGRRGAVKATVVMLDPRHTVPLTDASRDSMGQHILIIGELTLPQCKRYRVDQKVEMLQSLGYTVTVVPWQHPQRARRELQLHGLVIFYRVPAFPEPMELIEEVHRLGLPCFFDIDDMVFDVEEYSRNTNIQALPKAERDLLMSGGRLYRAMLEACGNGIASTATIAERMTGIGCRTTHVVENCLDTRTLTIAEEMRRRPIALAEGTVVIGYGSGTRTHDADFATVAEAILTVLQRYPQAVLAIYGHLTLPKAFDAVSDRIFRVPFLNADDYMRALASWHISIAPLERTVFNEAKSNIKYLEASIMGVPSVCSPTEPFRSVIEQGRTGFLAETPDAWIEALSRLVTDADLRRTMAAAARETVLARYRSAEIARTQVAPILEALPSEPSAESGGEGRPLRLLMVNLLFPPQSFGGATIVAEHLARHLPESGVAPVVMTGLWGMGLPEDGVHRYEVNGIPVIGVAVPKQTSRELDYDNPAMVTVMREVLDATRPDVVHFHSIQQLSASLAEACVEAGIPFVVTAHDAWWLCERQFMVREDGVYCDQRTIDLRICAGCMSDSAFTHKRFFHLAGILDKAALVLTPSVFQRDLYCANGWAPERVRVNENGVLKPATVPPARVGQTLRFAYLGGRASHKGYFWLKDILESLKERNWHLVMPDIQLRLGASSIPAKDWKKVRGTVEIVPPFDQDSMEAFYDGIDVLLVPSLWKESFGLTVREALARNVWVIATDSGGVVEGIVDGENGTVVGRGDTDAFRDAIRALLADPSRLDGYVNPYRGRVRDYETQARELAGLLTEVVDRHRATKGTSPDPALVSAGPGAGVIR